MQITPYQIAERFIGIKELPGGADNNPFIMAMLTLDNEWPQNDEVPWCSALPNFCNHLLRLPRSKSLMARSWLGVGQPVDVWEAKPGFDIVILSRGPNPPPAEVLQAPGHVGYFSSYVPGTAFQESGVYLLGGNQGNSVSVKRYDAERILGVRRIVPLC